MFGLQGGEVGLWGAPYDVLDIAYCFNVVAPECISIYFMSVLYEMGAEHRAGLLGFNVSVSSSNQLYSIIITTKHFRESGTMQYSSMTWFRLGYTSFIYFFIYLDIEAPDIYINTPEHF